MTKSDFESSYLRDPQLAAHALDPAPVWLWSADAERLLWANPTGALVFDAPSPNAASQISFGPQHPAVVQVARLAVALPLDGTSRLERLRGFGANFSGSLVCLCSRITLADNNTGLLVVSTERAGVEIALPDRARRLLADMREPAAIFTADGELIEAQPDASTRMGDCRDLTALGAEKLASDASINGSADGELMVGPVRVLKLGANSTFGLLVIFSNPPNAQSIDVRPMAAMAESPTVHSDAHSQYVPFRFVWQADAANRFSLASREFADLLGPKTAAALDRPWTDIAAGLGLDPQGEIASALSSRETFSGTVLFWPLDDIADRLPVEMSGLPVFDREREFKGFRGFGICRDLTRLQDIQHRRSQHIAVPPQQRQVSSKIVPFTPPTPEPETAASTPGPTAEQQDLTPRDRSAFQELARELSERLKKGRSGKAPADDFAAEPPLPVMEPPREPQKAAHDARESRPILDRLPIGILVYRLNNLIYANRTFLSWTGYPSLEALSEAGGLDSLFIEGNQKSSAQAGRTGTKTLTIATITGTQKPVEGRLFSANWNNENALVLMIDTRPGQDEKPAGASSRSATENPELGGAAQVLETENRELRAILDTATDGVLVLDRTGRILTANRSAEALFGYEPDDFSKFSFGDLLAPESRRSLLDHLERLANESGAGMLNAGYEAIARVRRGGLVPLYVTMGRIEGSEKLCAVLRDLTAWKQTAEELTTARQAAEKASVAKSEFLAKFSHEIRTPLNAIIGFSEVMMDERFGPIGNERYRQYLKDIHASGGHLISLLNDLIDLSKIEAGRLELTFVSVNLNDLVQQCVAIMQQQANRERVIVRTALSPNLPQIIADARSMRQIALNLLSNSIKFTDAGGQVIVSTALTDDQEVVLRVRDTGAGMSENEIETALEPFRQLGTIAHWGSSGTGLGLPITKALVEANQARFRVASEAGNGTLVEISFPTSRVLAQ